MALTPSNDTRHTRIPLVATPSVIAVRTRPYLAYVLALIALGAAAYAWKISVEFRALEKRDYAALQALEKKTARVMAGGAALKNAPVLGAVPAARHIQEADFYVHLAQQRLSLHHDATGARDLLQMADNLLAAQTDARTQPLRAAIARDQLALAAAAHIDIAGIHARLAAVSERVAGFSVPAELRGDASAASAEQSGGAHAAPQSVVAQGWQKLRGLIQVRHYDAAITPLLSASARQHHQQHIQLLLAQAQLALLQHEPRIFASSAAAANAEVAQYFPQLPAAQYRSVLQELSALAALDLRTATPTLSAVQASSALLALVSASSVTPSTSSPPSGAAP